MNKVNHVIECIRKAELGISKLSDDVLLIPRESGKKGKHFLNNLLDFKEAKHLEIGVKYGATLVSSLFKNNPICSYAVEFDTDNINLILSHKVNFNINFNFINKNCWVVTNSDIKDKINVFLFDGGHTYEDHYNALKYYYDFLEDEFIFIVDDWLDKSDIYYPQWKQVEEATRQSIKDLNISIEFETHKKRIIPEKDNWWGGYWISVLKKTNE